MNCVHYRARKKVIAMEHAATFLNTVSSLRQIGFTTLSYSISYVVIGPAKRFSLVCRPRFRAGHHIFSTSVRAKD